ncbi:unnamed protein product [Laminaria digitata]
MYFRFLLPATADFGSILYIIHAAWALFLAFNVFFNYFHCAFTHPGKPDAFLPRNAMSDSDDDLTCDDEDGLGTRPLISDGAAVLRVNVGGNGNAGNAEAIGDGARRGVVSTSGGSRGGAGTRVRCGYCKKCKEPKPARAHHCHVCDQCIVNMDHHCPWMNNCVGYLNYRYFVLFLLYMFVGCVYAVLISAPHFLAMANNTGRHRKPTASETKAQSAVMLTFVLALSVGIAISVLLGWHIYLVLTAQTTIEFYQNQTNRSRSRQWGEVWSNPFDVGYKGNWQQVFGQKPFLLGLMPSRCPPPPPVVDFFPPEEEDRRQRFSDEGEWTVDEPLSSDHIV